MQSLVNSATEAMTETAASSNLKPERPDESLGHDTVDFKSDLGFFINATKFAEDIERSVRSMSKGQKYHLLKHHDKPSCHYILSMQYLGGCQLHPRTLEKQEIFLTKLIIATFSSA